MFGDRGVPTSRVFPHGLGKPGFFVLLRRQIQRRMLGLQSQANADVPHLGLIDGFAGILNARNFGEVEPVQMV